ncbi:hypothetical protein Phum_PHUM460010 [Pediculus humanus corporis]|uniref:Uncharacterized protein n=1 Tax=Pediculus humanus subsp. corporis TaxID=121224 RepID=E0VV94_PEDHC|nr:uncharacterized protein Phum_PHUM460010 [Pediculus humanus corporis]EEB17300.1 hypothetical protein Phum_PHUM460010 [Pediculus humanus corporis]
MSPEVTPENMGKPMLCSYRFRSFRGTPKDWILRIRFKKFKVGVLLNATTCNGGYMQLNIKPQKVEGKTKVEREKLFFLSILSYLHKLHLNGNTRYTFISS